MLLYHLLYTVLSKLISTRHLSLRGQEMMALGTRLGLRANSYIFPSKIAENLTSAPETKRGISSAFFLTN